MRVSSNQVLNSGLNSMLEQQARLSKTQLQIASGKKILTPADDPAAAANVLNLQQSLNITTQYQENANYARVRLNTEETSLVNINNVLDRVRELAIQGNNATLSNNDRASIAVEVRQRIDELLALANSRDAGGKFLFAGYQETVQPFALDAEGNLTYSGDNGQRFIQIGDSRQVAVGDSGADLFLRIRNGNGIFTTRENADNTGSGVIDPGSVTDPAVFDRDDYRIIFPLETAAGSSLAFGDSSGNDTLSYSLSINGSVVYSVDESGTPVSSLEDLASVINDDADTTGVRAYVADGKLYLANATPSAQTITVTEAMSGASDGDSDTVDGYFGSKLTGSSSPSANITFGANDAGFYVVEDSSGNIEASGAYSDGVQIAFNGIEAVVTGTPRSSDSFSVSPSRNQDMFATLNNLVKALERGVSGDNGSATLNNAINRALVDIDQSMERVNQVRAKVGARLSAIDSQEGLNDNYKLQIESALSELQDLDYAEAISRLNQQQIALQAAQQSYVRIMGLSLFNFI